MLGFRGASRYYSERYREGFALECRAIKRVREEIGRTHVIAMIPFCRILEEADRVLEVMADYGLKRGDHDLHVYVMCEIPANVILAEAFAKRFDGFSIGSNDLTQLVLGVDRGSAELAYLFDERNEAVKRLIRSLIPMAHEAGCKVGVCGQAPSDYPEFAAFLVEAGIDSISLNPDSVIQVKRRVAEAEAQRRPGAQG
jgi:pyruvate,water dikinase